MSKVFTIEQLWTLLRTIIQAAGGGLVTKGVIDADTWTSVVGAIMFLITTVYGVYIRRREGLIASAAAVLPQGGVIATTKEIADKVPADNVVPTSTIK